MTRLRPGHFLRLSVLVWPLVSAGQVLVEASEYNTYLVERDAVERGSAELYLANRYSYEWRISMPDGSDDLLRSPTGDEWLRKERLKFYPALTATGYLNGAHLRRKGAYVDLYPLVTIAARYRLSPMGRYGLLFWTRFEKHSVVGQTELPDLSYDFSWEKEVGRRQYPGSDSTWAEYDIGDGGILFLYPRGEVTFAKANPIWGTGYAGQLWFSDKAPSFVFFSFRHQISNRWTLSFLHGNLNSALPDSSQWRSLQSGDLGINLPPTRKYVVAHRLDFRARENFRIGLGESVIYGGRDMELQYWLPILPYWSVQHELGDTDNLQMFLDADYVRRGTVRLYGALYVDEWDFVDTFRREKSRNWMAYQVGLTYVVSDLLKWNPLLRIEFTHLTPYVYVHESPLNTFEHGGHTLGFWSGPNSDNVFLALEGAVKKRWWVQLYAQRTRRGTANDETVEMQYTGQRIPFLYRPYEGSPETRILAGLRGDLSILSSFRIVFDIYSDHWLQRLDPEKGERTRDQKLDGMIRFAIGL
ncbi:MAG: capsule assembly Wzi family protein [Fidelibacterota bacterium]